MRKFSDNHQASTSIAHSVNLQKTSKFLFYSVNFHTQYSDSMPAKYITHTHTHTHTHSILLGWLNASVLVGSYKDKISTSE